MLYTVEYDKGLCVRFKLAYTPCGDSVDRSTFHSEWHVGSRHVKLDRANRILNFFEFILLRKTVEISPSPVKTSNFTVNSGWSPIVCFIIDKSKICEATVRSAQHCITQQPSIGVH